MTGFVALACGLAFLAIAPGHSWALSTREADKTTNQVLDTSVAIGNAETPATWEIALPSPAWYWVSVTCGDAQYDYGPHKVVLEGTEIINQQTSSSEWVSAINQPVYLTDGYLSMTIGGGATDTFRPYTLVNSIVITNQDPGSQSFTPMKISFGPATPTPSPSDEPWTGDGLTWLQDTGLAYGDRGNGQTYGWTTDYSGRVFYRSGYSDGVVLDSLFASDPSMTCQWDVAVPNGMYYVSLRAGDAQYPRTAQKILIEDIAVLPEQFVSAGTFAEVDGYIINVFDGSMTMKVGGTTDYVAINCIKVTNVKPAIVFPVQINLQPGYETAVAGYTIDSGYLYNASRGFGWDQVRPAAKYGTDPLYGTYCATFASAPRTWKLDVDDGTYYTYAALGHPTASFTERLRFESESPPAVNDVYTPAGTYTEVANHAVTVSDAQLNATLGGGSSISTLSWLIIDNQPRGSWTFPVNINYQPEFAVPPDGYEVDYGAPYNPVRMYGWDVARKVAEKDVNPDQRLDTYLAVPNTSTSYWNILVPNGTYYVTLAVGCPVAGFTHWVRCVDSSTTIVNDVFTAANNYYTVNNHQVTVSDTKLTLQVGRGSGASYTTICYVRIGTSPF
jgi:hypothetical protein